MRTVSSSRHGAVRLRYRLRGTRGPMVVFLHGLAGHLGEWDRTTEALRGDYRTIAVDQRGHGASSRVPADVSREAFVHDVLTVVDDARCTGPVTVVGQSMGAHTALLTASRYPEWVERLVMVEGDVGGGGEVSARRLRDALDAWPDHFPSFEAARDFFGGDNERGRAWARGYRQGPGGWWPQVDRRVLNAAMHPLFAVEHWREWRELRTPTLLVLGERSGLDSGRVERMCRLRPNTSRVTIAEAGHDVHLEQPQAWLTTLRGFLPPASAAR